MDLRTKIALSLQRALLNNISKHVRGICCDWNDNLDWFKIIFYIDIEPNMEESELLSVVMTEFSCDLQHFEKFYEECIFSDKPYYEIDNLRMVVFWREENL